MTTWADVQAWSPVPLTPEHAAAIAAAYAHPPRAYHSLAHVVAVIAQWRDVDRRLGWGRRAETFLALLYHDAVYVAGRADNEAQSAALARGALTGMAGIDVGEVERLIALTAAHGKLAPGDVDRDTALVLDCDMAVLGGLPAEYAAYAQGIASEYGHLPRPLYAAGRRQFLERLLAKPRIFLSDDAHARLDAQARVNIAEELARLDESPG
jgi:predicted metal-dependent HD superfamily phosphohydrolase